MRVALIGDVHANLPALEAVLRHAEGQRAEAIWNVGDFVGYGAFPDEVVRRLSSGGTVSVIGNYDLEVLAFPEHEADWRESKRPEKFRAFQWAWESLSDSSRAFLASTPRERRLDVDGLKVLLTHGSPASIDEHLDDDTRLDRLVELAGMAQADVVVCGHSHRPFARRVGTTTFINTGSVGRQDDGDPRACYAMCEIGADDVRPEHFRIDYDVDQAAEAIRSHGLPEAFAHMTRRGRKLAWILKRDGREGGRLDS